MQSVVLRRFFIDVVEDAVYRIRESPTHWGVMDVLILTECGCCVAMDLYSLALNFVESSYFRLELLSQKLLSGWIIKSY